MGNGLRQHAEQPLPWWMSSDG